MKTEEGDFGRMQTPTGPLMVAGHIKKLRDLASWYRERAQDAENPWTRKARLRTAEDLEAEAQRIEREQVWETFRVGSRDTRARRSITVEDAPHPGRAASSEDIRCETGNGGSPRKGKVASST